MTLKGGVEVFIEGAIAGIFAGVYKRTGINVDEGSLIVMVSSSICQALQIIPSSVDCWNNVKLITYVVIILSIVGFLISINKVGNWVTGLIIFGLGFVCAFVLF